MRLRDLRNLGPASERMLKAAGIATPRQLDRVGAVEAYRRALRAGGHASLNFLWSLEAALLDLDWRDLPNERREALRREAMELAPEDGGSTIRPATLADVARLQDIEREAGRRFGGVGLAAVAEDAPPSAEDLAGYIDAGRAWVHEEGADGAVGYLLLAVVDGNAHIDQVSVVPAHAGRGVGRGLVDHARATASAWGFATTTLTTFRDVPWNAPYYRTLGFEVVDEGDIGPELRALMVREDRFGEPRVAMGRSS
jgi:GNAT superfamily N-acetyltransferase